MNANEKLVAAARRAAKTLSRTSERSYQTCLDEIARSAGKSTWSAFLADPVPVDANAADAASEPDFTLIEPEMHLPAVVGHGGRIGATGFVASPRAWGDDAPMLRYRLEDGRPWPVDARGLSIEAISHSFGFVPIPPFEQRNGMEYYGDGPEGMATCCGVLMRTRAHRDMNRDTLRIAVSASLDGSEPEACTLPTRPVEERGAAPPPARTRTRRPGMMTRLKRLVIGNDEANVRDMIDRRMASSDEGPVIGILRNGRRVRLRPGAHVAAFSPPGTGRMVGITIPALLGDDATSYVVHDDGQLLANTQGWRRSIGRVAVIRLDAKTDDAINPFGRPWLPISEGRVLDYCDRIAAAIVPEDPRVSRLIGQVAADLIRLRGETTLREVRDAIATDRDKPMAREAIAALMPLASPLADAATSRSTVVPAMMHGDREGRPLTLYIVRDVMASGTRARLAAVLQTAIWYHSIHHGPGRPVEGREDNGPCPLGTIMHDFHRLPAMPMLPIALDYGADRRASVIITGSTAATIAERYGKDAALVDVMIGMRLVLQQSDVREIQEIDPLGKVAPRIAASLGRWQGILLAQRCAPARMRLPVYFEDAEMVARSNIQP